MVEFVVRCRQCGNERQTFNDPRVPRTFIECKAKCFESHFNWDYVRDAALQTLPFAASSKADCEGAPRDDATAASGIDSGDRSPNGSSPPAPRKREGWVGDAAAAEVAEDEAEKQKQRCCAAM